MGEFGMGGVIYQKVKTCHRHCQRQTYPSISGGFCGLGGNFGRLTRTVGTLIRGGLGGRSCFGTWFQGMVMVSFWV